MREVQEVEQRIQDNAVGLTGILAQDFTEISSIYGQQYRGYRTAIRTTRRSGAQDEAVVFCAADTAQIKAGAPVMCYGKIQTFKDFKSGKVLVYVLAELLQQIEGKYWENENAVKLAGVLGKGITYRETPNGRHITDIKVITPNAIREGGSCFVPCICWNRKADEVKDWAEGERVQITGRLQSRTYSKKAEDGSTMEHTAYEVSVQQITKEGAA